MNTWPVSDDNRYFSQKIYTDLRCPTFCNLKRIIW